MASSIVSPDIFVSDESDYYHVNECSPHGICVVIDNSQFTNFLDSLGSNHDVTNISKTFENLTMISPFWHISIILCIFYSATFFWVTFFELGREISKHCKLTRLRVQHL